LFIYQVEKSWLRKKIEKKFVCQKEEIVQKIEYKRICQKEKNISEKEI